MDRHVYFGNFFHNLSFDKSEIILDGFIAVEDGKVWKLINSQLVGNLYVD